MTPRNEASYAAITLVWDFGGSETEENVTRDQLWELIQQGRKDTEGKVTSLVIWVNDPDEQP